MSITFLPVILSSAKEITSELLDQLKIGESLYAHFTGRDTYSLHLLNNRILSFSKRSNKIFITARDKNKALGPFNERDYTQLRVITVTRKE